MRGGEGKNGEGKEAGGLPQPPGWLYGVLLIRSRGRERDGRRS